MKITLASNQQAHYPIVIHPDASDRVVGAANDLREKLDQITGASFNVMTGTADGGIKLEIDAASDPFEVGTYELRTHSGGLRIIGWGDVGLRNGVWGLLKDIGYRMYMPEDLWEHIPDISTLEVEFDKVEKPSFFTRRGPKPPAWTDRGLWDRYKERNRLGRDAHMRTNHEYNRIVERNQEIFDANPQFISHLSTNAKFRLSAKGEWEGKQITVFDVVVADAIRQVEENQHYTSVPLSPSDGTGGWALQETDDPEEWNWKPHEHGLTDPTGDGTKTYENYDAASITNRVVILANEVAKALYERFGRIIYVTYTSYALNRPPPDIPIHPHTYIETVGGFARLAPGWKAMGAKFMGVYDRAVLLQHSDGVVPVQGGGSMRYVQNTIPFYYENSARTFRTDCEDAWGIYGLPFYAMSRKLWDVTEDAFEVYNGFLSRMFSGVEAEMGEYFDMVNQSYLYPPRTRNDYIARAYRILQKAYEATDDKKVKERIDYITLYWRYIDLYHIHRRAADPQSSVEAVGRHLYRMSQRQLSLITKWYRHYLERSNRPGDPTYEQMEEFNFRRPMDRQLVGRSLNNRWPWEDNRPFSKEEINQMRLDGIENYEPDEWGFDMAQFSTDLRPAQEHLNLDDSVNYGRLPRHAGSTQYAHIWLEKGEPFRLLVKNDTLRTPREVPLSVDSPKDQIGKPVFEQNIIPDIGWHEILVTSPHSGLHTISWSPGTARTYVFWPDMIVDDVGNWAGYYTRTDTREWRNASGYRFWRRTSNSNWGLYDPDGNQVAEGNDEGRQDPSRSGGWDGVLSSATMVKNSDYKGVMEFSPISPVEFHRPPDFEFYFYVPKGTKIVGGVSPRHNHTTIRLPDGTVVVGWQNQEINSGPFAIDVPEGADGKLWFITATRGGEFSLLTVPPYLTRHPDELLLPREVIEADAGIDLPDEDGDYDQIPPDDDDDNGEPDEPIEPPDDEDGEEPEPPDDDNGDDPEPEPPEEPEEPPVEEPEDPQPEPIFKGFEAPRTESGYMGVYVDGVHKSNHLHESTAIPIALSHKITNPGSAVKIKQELVITINLK